MASLYVPAWQRKIWATAPYGAVTHVESGNPGGGGAGDADPRHAPCTILPSIDEPATVNFIIEGSKLRAAVEALTAAFGEVYAIDIGAATELRALDIDLIRSTNHQLFAEALDRVRKVGEWTSRGLKY
jgi:hypothetical protein